MKRFVLALALTIGSALPAHAQVSAGVYGGVASGPTSTFMVMSDIGTRVDLEPWAQSYGSVVQVGGDVIIIPKWIGVTVGGYSNPGTFRAGIAFNPFRNAQVRVMRTSDDQWQGIVYYNVNLTPRTYIQFWAAPGSNSSSYLVGVGHTFRP